ncbi:DeoR/GlpR family DNA-binding transcription regulator [Atribacter laminatus]|uniref:Glucitol operon repressor n=1 Tax=Atribacter laminatus TaxID=2847778 RepID=A0A7T1AN44_ATRLM|nr:DeoR/GlpR family DNA-binding transcription regulator [Atribacter laminatus]QPM68981.1 Glucitol operon repressor [Atribacter laminatus]
MSQFKRKDALIKLLQENGEIRVTDLSKFFRVSKNTIRRDLEKLENEGLLQKVHGGAILSFNSLGYDIPYKKRENSFKLEKVEIGRLGASIIKNGDSIILDIGTTTYQIAKNLALSKKRITVITNAINIVNVLGGIPEIELIFSGGTYKEAVKGCSGFYAEEFFSHIHVDKLFLSCGGINFEKGIMNPNSYEINVKRNMIKSAKEVILVAHHEKIGKPSFAILSPLDILNVFITDKGIPLEIVAEFEKRGIQVLH